MTRIIDVSSHTETHHLLGHMDYFDLPFGKANSDIILLPGYKPGSTGILNSTSNPSELQFMFLFPSLTLLPNVSLSILNTTNITYITSTNPINAQLIKFSSYNTKSFPTSQSSFNKV